MEKLEAGRAHRVGPWTLVPVALTVIHASCHDRWSHAYASKDPYAVLVLGPGGVRFALDTEGSDIPIDELVAETPELETILGDAAGGLGTTASQ